jgi:nucleotide-binding universal stress UspA family protein
MDALKSGDEIDGFKVQECIHVGGMALLYRVSSPRDPGFPLIMKVPRLGQGDDAVSVVSFEVEQMMLGALQGPHVPRLVAAGDLARQPYLVMEYIDGRCLNDWLASAPLAAVEIARLMVPLASAAHHLHCQEFVHLDIKPTNVMYRADGEAVLIDLGLGHHAHLPDLLAEESRKAVGSAPYMAPEQVVGVRCDPRSDIFALGAVMYELATGELPFGRPGSTGGLRQRLYRDPVPPRARRPDLPEWLQEIILHCLEVDGRRRYATAAQLAFDLVHPDQVTITERGHRVKRQGALICFRRWLRAAGWEPTPCPPPTEQIFAAPIVMVAVATEHDQPAQAEALQEVAKRVASMDADCRIAVVSVIRPYPLLGTSRPEESGGKLHIRHLVQLKHWAAPLGLPPDRLTYHVIEGNDPAVALLQYARVNQVDQIVIGAPPVMGVAELGVSYKPVLGTVASRVALEASCTVTLVRARVTPLPAQRTQRSEIAGV